jgi:uncharacterized membrane protein (DUF2068 family)
VTASRPELPSWQEAQDQAVTHATAAEDQQDPSLRQHHAQLAQVWATIALSRATMEQTNQLALSLQDLSGTIHDLPRDMPR